MKMCIYDVMENIANSLVGKEVKLPYWRRFKTIRRAELKDYDDEYVIEIEDNNKGIYRIFIGTVVEVKEEINICITMN